MHFENREEFFEEDFAKNIKNVSSISSEFSMIEEQNKKLIVEQIKNNIADGMNQN